MSRISRDGGISLDNRWKKLLNSWEGKKYQIPNRRVTERFKYVKKHAKKFEGLTVLDLGCNAALYALPLVDHVKGYVGVEGADKYYVQAVDTVEILGRKARVFKSRIEDLDFMQLDCDALIVSRVLYYLSDECLGRIQEQLLPKCKVVLMINGTRKKKEKRNSWNFWNCEAGVRFLRGFSCNIEKGEEGASYRILGERCA